jgi:hypothetical protein
MFLSQLFFWGGWMTQQCSVFADKPFILVASLLPDPDA